MWEDTPTASQGSASVGAPYSNVSISTSWESSTSIGTALVISTPGISTSQGGSGGDVVDPSLPLWPSYTDIVFNPGLRKVTLMLQHAPLHSILQDTFKKIQVYLLFNHSFPDAAILPAAIRHCLISAATESQDPQALDICEQLNCDDVYIDKLSCLVRSLYYQLSLCWYCACSCMLTYLFTALISRSVVWPLYRPISWELTPHPPSLNPSTNSSQNTDTHSWWPWM